MLFSSELLPKVLDRTKTVTRRLAVAGKPCRYVEGRDYAVQAKRGGPAIARIRVLSVRRERFADWPLHGSGEALIEGFANAAEMEAWWLRRHGPNSSDWPVWRIGFQLLPAPGDPPAGNR